MSNTTTVSSGLRPIEGGRGGWTWTVIVQVTVLAVLLGWVYWPVLDYMVAKWRSDGDWSHGWLVPLFSLYFLHTQRTELKAARRSTSWAGLALMVLSLVIYYGSAHVGGYAYPQRLSLVPCLMGLVLMLCGWQIIKIAWFPIAYLVLAIPLPEWLFFDLTFPLRRIASLVAGTLLGALPDVYTEIAGVVIDYEYRGYTSSLNIEEACSGMRLMMAFIALGAAVAYLGRRPLWHRVILVVCCVPIAVFCNMIRVFVTGVLHVYGYRDLSQGSAHELLGLAMLPIALGLFTFTGWVLNNLFVDAPEAASTEPAEVAPADL